MFISFSVRPVYSDTTQLDVELGCELCRYKRALMCLVVAYFKSTLNDVKAPDTPTPPHIYFDQ